MFLLQVVPVTLLSFSPYIFLPLQNTPDIILLPLHLQIGANHCSEPLSAAHILQSRSFISAVPLISRKPNTEQLWVCPSTLQVDALGAECQS